MLMNRNQLPEADRWRLEDIYQTDEHWNQDYAEAQRRVRALAGYAGKLGQQDQLKNALDQMFALELQVGRLYSYARMRRDEDNNLTQYQALVDRAQTLAVELGTATSFVAPELLSLSEDYLATVRDKPGFEDYKVYLGELIRRRPHTLSAAEERIVAMAGELSAGPLTIYKMLTDADLKFPSIKDEHGETVPVTQGGFIPLMMNRNRSVRRAAFESLYGTFKSLSATLPAIYAASVKADLFAAQTGKFQSALEAALFPDQIPLSVYESLIRAVRNHLPGLNKFVTLNARLLGLSDPSMIDVYVPAAFGFDINLSFDEAYDLVCNCLGILGQDYVDVLRRARKGRWIDPYQSEGKSSGAYSWGTYDTHPYVLLNYHENLDGLQTIAHEMGHAMHSHLSNKNQPFPTADYSLFVAEVASTVNEVLVLLKLLDRHKEREAQAYLLYNLLDSYRSTVFRQTMFAEFEKISHKMAESGQALTVDSLNKAYAELNGDYYKSIAQPELIACEWMRIPHFYSAFYVYKYATGFSAATAIATMIRTEGAPAVERYKRFLSAGSSLSPIEALKLAGIDMSSPVPVEQSLQMFEQLLKRYEAAVEPHLR